MWCERGRRPAGWVGWVSMASGAKDGRMRRGQGEAGKQGATRAGEVTVVGMDMGMVTVTEEGENGEMRMGVGMGVVYEGMYVGLATRHSTPAEVAM